jgi:hypothetical protein
VSGDRDRRPSSSAGANRLCEHLSLSLNCCKLQLLLTSRQVAHAKVLKWTEDLTPRRAKWTERSHAKTPRRKGRRKILTSADSLHFCSSPTDEHSVKIGQVPFFGSDSVGRGTLSNAIGLQRSSYLLPILASWRLGVRSSVHLGGLACAQMQYFSTFVVCSSEVIMTWCASDKNDRPVTT